MLDNPPLYEWDDLKDDFLSQVLLILSLANALCALLVMLSARSRHHLPPLARIRLRK